MTSENATVEISDDARQAAYRALLNAREGCYDFGQTSAQILEAVAPLVVAAELRRIADEGEATGLLTFRDLRARADELDPGSPAVRDDEREA